MWTWTALDADSKLMISWKLGARHAANAHAFMRDVQERLISPRVRSESCKRGPKNRDAVREKGPHCTGNMPSGTKKWAAGTKTLEQIPYKNARFRYQRG